MPDESWIIFWVLMLGWALFASEAYLGFPISLHVWRTAKIWRLKAKVRRAKLIVGISLSFRQEQRHALDESGQAAFWRAISKLEGVFAVIVADLKDSSFNRVDLRLELDMGSWDMRYGDGDYEQQMAFTMRVTNDQEPTTGCIRIPITKWRPAWLAN